MATVTSAFNQILAKVSEYQAPTRQECRDLLTFPEHSLEARILMAAADHISRRRFNNTAMLLGQIGLVTSKCPGRCRFCAFGADHSAMQPGQLGLEQVLERACAFSDQGDLYALFLMTMHDFDFAPLLATIAAVRQAILPHTKIVLNIGDFDFIQAKELRAAGADGAYHICRLREGTDTGLDPARRKQTIDAIKKADMDFYYCCEPIGPEHEPEELVDQLFLGIEYGCFQHAAMRRVRVPGTPLAVQGQITELRLAQIVAVVTLAALGCPETKSIAVHEPNLLGLCAGANTIYAETGANPRDTVTDTANNRGLDMPDCRKMLCEAGFEWLLRGDDRKEPLATF
jgi:biotin synthase